jgi:hypothetical protein
LGVPLLARLATEGSVIKIVNLCFYAGSPRADSTVLCHVITHGDVAISLMNITHLLDSLSKAKMINEAETSPH